MRERRGDTGGQPKRNQSKVTDFDIHKAYMKAALDMKRDCEELVDLLVAELREQGPNQRVELLRAAIEGGRKAESLWQWAKIALLMEAKIPRQKLDELEALQVSLAAFLTRGRGGT